MKLKLKVTQTDTFVKVFEIEADTFDEAKRLIVKDLDECPLDIRSNTFDGSDTNIEKTE